MTVHLAWLRGWSPTEWVAGIGVGVLIGTEVFIPEEVKRQLAGTVAELLLGLVTLAGGIALLRIFFQGRAERLARGENPHTVAQAFVYGLLWCAFGLFYIVDYATRGW